MTGNVTPLNVEDNPSISIEILVYKNGMIKITSTDEHKKPLAQGMVRKTLRDSLSYVEDRFQASLAENAARTVLEQAQQTKNRNGMFNFLRKK